MHEQIKIEDASREQLHQFAELVLGVELTGQPQKATLLAKISSIQPDRTEIPNLAAPVVPQPSADKSGGHFYVKDESKLDADGKPRRFAKILVHTSNGPGGEEPVFVSVNGRGMWIPRGEEVEVGAEYIGALQNAVRDVYDPTTDPLNQRGLSAPRKVQSYPFSFA